MYRNIGKEPEAAKSDTVAGGDAAASSPVHPYKAMQTFNNACIDLSEASAIRMRAEEAEQRAMAKVLSIDPFLSDAKRYMLIRQAEQHADRAAAAAKDRDRSTDLLRHFFPA